jgi:hypothetical protein
MRCDSQAWARPLSYQDQHSWCHCIFCRMQHFRNHPRTTIGQAAWKNARVKPKAVRAERSLLQERAGHVRVAGRCLVESGGRIPQGYAGRAAAGREVEPAAETWPMEPAEPAAPELAMPMGSLGLPPTPGPANPAGPLGPERRTAARFELMKVLDDPASERASAYWPLSGTARRAEGCPLPQPACRRLAPALRAERLAPSDRPPQRLLTPFQPLAPSQPS